MTKVLNIISNGLKREGITSTQIEYMKYIDKTNLQIDIAAVHNDEPEVVKTFEKLGCRVIHFPDRYGNLAKYSWSLYKVIRKEKYDVVHVHGSSSLLAIELFVAKVAGVKIRIAHSRNTQCKYKVLDQLLRPFFYSTYNIALACGDEAGEFLFEDRQYVTLHNGKDFDKFGFSKEIRNDIRKGMNLEDKLAIGFVGSLNEQKNPFFLIDIFAEIKPRMENAHLIIMGDGPKRKAVEEYAVQKGIFEDVTFMGRIINVNEVIQGMDIMLLPSLYEGLPNVVLEWQISGLVSLVSDKVTKECKVSELVKFLPIDVGTEVWTNAIMAIGVQSDRVKSSEVACQEMKKAGYEIKESAARLRDIYINGVVS